MSKHVIIAGAGPCGLLVALGLAQAGSRVTVLEEAEDLNDSPRAIVYHHPVLPHLEKLGVLEDCMAAGMLREVFAWHIHETGEMIQWDTKSALDGTTPYPYALHLHQGLLSRIAARHVEANTNVELRRLTRLTGCKQHDTGVVAELETASGSEQLEADYLIGADGATSLVRKQILGLNFFGYTWPERYIATNTRIDLDSLGYCKTTMQIDHKHGAVICKIDDSDLWRVTFMEDARLPDDGIAKRIEEMFVDHLPSVPYEVAAYSPYRMHQRIADSMRVGRVLLVGDAAHVTNPTGGLGLTGGMFDSFALIEALNRVMHDGASEDLLDFYEADRRRIFIELTSPRASDNLRNLYKTYPGIGKDALLARLREIAENKDLMRQELSFTENMETQFPG